MANIQRGFVMKRGFIVALSILLMLFAFASCSNESKGPSVDESTAQDIAAELEPNALIKDVFTKSEADGVKISYNLASDGQSQASRVQKAANGYTLTATVEFEDYTNASSITIESGILKYVFKGTISNSVFSASSYSISTEQTLKISGKDISGTVDVVINVRETTPASSKTVFKVTLESTENGATSIAANTAITVDITLPKDSSEITVGGQPVEIPEESTPEPTPEPIEYADSKLAASLIDSIDKEQVAKDILAVVNNQGEGLGLTITPNLSVTMEEAATTGKADITVIASVNNYTNGLHDKDNRTLVEGEVEIVLSGDFEKTPSGFAFTLKNYTAKTTKDVKINDKSGEFAGDHSFALKKLSGEASGIISITLPSREYTVSGDVYLVVPAASAVEAVLDTKPVDYNQLCKDTGFAVGDHITVEGVVTEEDPLPAGLTVEIDEATGGYAIVRDEESGITPSGDVVIPETVKGVPVTKIGVRAFAFSDVTSVKLPETIEIIDEEAFDDCGELQDVNIPESVVEIRDRAFYFCESLAIELELPSGLTVLGEQAFGNCSNMDAMNGILVIPNDVKELKNRTFAENYCIDAYVIPAGCQIEGEMYSTPWEGCYGWPAGVDYSVACNIFLSDDEPEGGAEFETSLETTCFIDTDYYVYWNGEWNMDSSNPQPVV